MKRQVYNPYLPSWEYIPDGEPRVFNDRLYIFGSHDRFGGKDYCENDYVAWSTPIDDLSDWRYEGVIFTKEQTPWNTKKDQYFAPDVVQGNDGKYYLYYFVAGSCMISVAVCDEPAGKYQYLGEVKLPDGHAYGSKKDEWFTFDPSVLVDNDKRIWLYTGSGQPLNEKYGHAVKGCFVVELESDMLTIKSEPKVVLPAKWTMEEPNFFEGASVRHIGEWYYIVYPASDMTGLNYAMSKYPDRDFIHKGRIHSTSDIGYENRSIMESLYPIGNNHGGLVCVNKQWYIFDHRMTNNTYFSRQGVAEPIIIKEDGLIDMVEATSCGLNNGPLSGKGKYPAYICCNLVGKMPEDIGIPPKWPYVTQDGDDYNPDESHNRTINIDSENEAPKAYVAGISNECQIGFKYFDMSETSRLVVTTRYADGIIQILDAIGGNAIAETSIVSQDIWVETELNFNPRDIITQNGLKMCPLYLKYIGAGEMNLISITLS